MYYLFLGKLGRNYIAKRGRTGDLSTFSPRDRMVTCLKPLSSFSLIGGRKLHLVESKFTCEVNSDGNPYCEEPAKINP